MIYWLVDGEENICDRAELDVDWLSETWFGHMHLLSLHSIKETWAMF